MSNFGNIEINTDKLTIKSDKNICCESFYFSEIFDDVATKKFIKNTERLIRKSPEYNEYIHLLRTNVPTLNYDSVMSNIGTCDADLEFHHYPLTLYDIVEVVLNYHMLYKDKVTSFSIAKEVMDCHYKNIIGLVSLSNTMHQLSHLGSIFINKNQIFGDYSTFLQKYKDGMTFDIKKKVERIELFSDNNVAIDFKGIL